MNEADEKVFPVTEKNVDFKYITQWATYVTKKYYFKENMDNIEWCKKKLKM